jgi:hypothetical protein
MMPISRSRWPRSGAMGIATRLKGVAVPVIGDGGRALAHFRLRSLITLFGRGGSVISRSFAAHISNPSRFSSR